MECIHIEVDISPKTILCIRKKQDARQVMFNNVKELQKKDFKPFAISRKPDISRQTATKYCSIDALPERRSKLRNGYHVFDKYVEEKVKRVSLCQLYMPKSRSKDSKEAEHHFMTIIAILVTGIEASEQKIHKPQKKEEPKDEGATLMNVKTMVSLARNSILGRELSDEENILIEQLNEKD